MQFHKKTEFFLNEARHFHVLLNTTAHMYIDFFIFYFKRRKCGEKNVLKRCFSHMNIDLSIFLFKSFSLSVSLLCIVFKCQTVGFFSKRKKVNKKRKMEIDRGRMKSSSKSIILYFSYTHYVCITIWWVRNKYFSLSNIPCLLIFIYACIYI